MQAAGKLLILFFFFTPCTTRGANPDSLRAAEQGARFLEALAQDPAAPGLDSVRHCHRQADDLTGWINLCKQAGKVLRDRRALPRQGLDYMLHATEDRLWRSPRSPEEWEALAWLLANVAFTYNNYLDDFNPAARYYEQALTILVDRLDREDLLVAEYLYLPLGNLKTKLGEEAAAEVYLKKGLALSLDQGSLRLAADACSDLSVLYLGYGRLPEAVRVLEEGLDLPGLPPFTQGLLQGNLALVYTEMGAYEKALTHARSSRRSFVLDTLHRASDSPRIKLAGVERMLGEISGLTGRYDEARAHFRNAEQLLLRIYPGGRHRSLSKLYYAWGNLHHRRGDYDRALRRQHQSLQASLETFDPPDDHALPSPEQLHPDVVIAQALAGKAETLTARYDRGGDRRDLKTALRCHELIFEVEKMLRHSYHYESSKLFNLEESRARSEKAIALALQLTDLTGNDGYREQAFAFAERSKSILLLESFLGDNAALAADIPAARRTREESLQAEIARLEKNLYEARNAPDSTRQALQEQLLALRQHYTTFIRELETDFPAYYNLRYKFEPVTPGQVRAFLAPGQALVEYFTGREKIYVFVVTTDRYEVLTLERDFPLNEWVVQLRRDIEAFQFGGADRQVLCGRYSDRAHRLYERLVAPLEALDLPPRLLLIPSGVLGYLPFDALLTAPAPEGCRFDRYPYLLHRYTLSYGYSATLQAELAARQYDRKGFLGVAPAFDGGGGFAPLQNTENSLNAVAGRIGGEVLSGPGATIAAFRAAAPGYRILQLATHAQANTEQGDFSFVVFSGTGGGYDSLFVKDVYRLDLAAELVVLSACETAVGTVYESEGIISLARGFLYAGARSLITTLWSINEGTNLRLIESFYGHWADGRDKDEALRRAKLDHLAGSDRLRAHPVYWAALAPIGEMQGTMGPTGKMSWWVMALGMPVVLIGVVLFRVRRRREG